MRHLTFPKNNKIYLISDIHGGLNLLKRLIAHIEKESYLIVLGDIIEKGSQSLETLQYVMELSNNDNVFVILGNNDIGFLKSLEPTNINSFIKRANYNKSLVYQMIKYAKLEGDYSSLQKQIKQIFSKEIRWYESLDILIETDDFIFVHAGIDKRLDYQNSSLKTILTINNFYDVGHISNKIVVCGHYPNSIYYNTEYNNNIIIDLDKKIICIDGGYGATNIGQLNMLEIKKINKSYQYKKYFVDDFIEGLILKDQNGYGNNKGVRYPNYDIIPLTTYPYFTKSKIIATNEIVYVKNEYIRNVNGKYSTTDDVPNNILNLSKGDIVKIIRDDTSGFALIKKDGICGWVNKEYLIKN